MDHLDGLDPDPSLRWSLGYIYSGLGPLPKMKAGRDPTMAKFEGRQLVWLILTKGGLRLQSFRPRRRGGLDGDLRPTILVVLVL